MNEAYARENEFERSRPGKALILGSGPAGLATAVRLARAGLPVKLIERLPWTGGLCKSYQRGPYTLDLGPHRFTPHSREVYDFVVEDLKVPMRTVRYQAEIFLGGRFITFPFRISELFGKIPPALSARLISTYLPRFLTRGTGKGISCEEWILNNFGTEITKQFFRPLLEKVWANPLSRLSVRFARQRIATAKLWEVAWEALSGRRPAKFHSNYYPDNCFLYPEDGYGAITDRMTTAFERAGGELTTDSSVKEIWVENSTVRKVVYDRAGRIEAEEDPIFVVTTIPIQYFFEIVRPAVSESILSAARRLKTRRLILFYLVVERDQFCKSMLVYFPSSEFPFSRIWEQKNQSPRTIAAPGKTVLGLELPCWESDAVWKMESGELFELCIAPLEKYGLLRKSEVEEYFSVKLGSVYPVWDIEFETNLEKLLEWERSVENLIFNGRQGLFFYNNLHHSLEMGFVAASHVLSGLSKHEKWDMESKAFSAFQLVE